MEKQKIGWGQKIRQGGGAIVDKIAFALKGWKYLLVRPKYFLLFISLSLVLLYVLAQLQDGGTVWSLLFSKLSLERKFTALRLSFQALLGCFTSLHGWLLVLLALMQALALCGIVYALRHREKNQALNQASSGGIASVLAIVTLGCPTCGISLLTPILTMLVGTGAVALAEKISGILLLIAFVLLAITLIQLGYLVFVTHNSKQAKEEDAKSH